MKIRNIVWCALLISYSFSLHAMKELGDAVAYLREVKNETPFDLELFAEAPMGDSFDVNAKTVSGRVIRLRSKKIEGRPYVRAVEIEGSYRLVADGKNPDEQAAHFMLQQYVNDEGVALVGLRSCLNPAFLTVVGWYGTGEVYCTNAVVAHETQKWSQWQMFSDPNRNNEVWFQNVSTRGWLEVAPRFTRELFEGDLLAKTRIKGEDRAKEWCDPWVHMASTPDGTLRIGGPSRRAMATENAAFEIEIVADPVYPQNFKPLFDGKGYQVTANAEHVVILGDKGEPYYLVANEKKWQSLSVEDANKKIIAPFISVAIGEDKALFAVNFEGNVYRYEWTANQWVEDGTEKCVKVSAASEKLVWAIAEDNSLLSRTGPNAWSVASSLATGYPQDVSVGADGTVFVAGSDQVLYMKDGDSWIIPNYSLKATAVSCANKDTVIIIASDYTPYKAVPGRNYEQWTPVQGTLFSAAITQSAQVVGVGGLLSEDGFSIVQGDLYQDTEIEPASSFDMKPYRWPERKNGFKIAGNSGVNLGRLGFTVRTGSGIMQGLSLRRTPEIRGFSYMKPDMEFMRGKFLSLGSMYGRGYAWLEKSLSSPGKATLAFRARTQAEGDLHVVMGERVGNQCLYRIVFGGNDNTVSAILKEGETVLENPISVERDPRAATLPGAFELFWVSVDNGFIMAGKGFPGQNIFMARRDPRPPASNNGQSSIRNFGFSSFKSIDPIAVDITEVVTMPSLSFIPPMRTFIEDPRIYTLDKSGNSQWIEHPFRTPGEGMATFAVQGNGTLRIRFGEDAIDNINEFKGYEVLLRSQGPLISQIARCNGGKTTVVSQNSQYPAVFNNARPTRYWISCNQGTITVGHGNPGENPFMVWDDQEDEAAVMRVGFASLEGNVQVGKIQLAPPVDINFMDPQMSYEKKYDDFKMPTSLIVVEPIRLQMTQVGSSLQIIDRLDNMPFNIAGVPGVGRTIPYRLSVLSDGTAECEQLDAGKETKERLAIQKGAQVMQGVANLIGFMAPGFSLGGPIGIAAGMALSGAGLAIGAKGFEMQAAVDYANTRDTEYVFQEEFTKRSITSSEVTPMMEQYKMRAYAEIEKTDLLDPSSVEGYQALMKAYQNIILYSNNAYVSDDAFIKEKLFSGLDQLMVYSENIPITMYNDLLNLYVSAYNNMYLIDKNNSIDASRRQQWALTISNLATELFKNLNEEGVTFKGLYGLYLWFDKLLPQDGRGYIEFEAKGLSDIMVAFSPEAFTNNRNGETEMYELGFGVAGNSKFVIRNKNLAKTPTFVRTSDQIKQQYLKSRSFKGRNVPNGMATPQSFSKYAINIHDGRIAIWHNQPYEDQEPLIEWVDPYPQQAIASVGLSCWGTPVTFRNVKIYGSLFEGSDEEEKSVVAEDIDYGSWGTSATEETVEEEPKKEERPVAVSSGIATTALPFSTAESTASQMALTQQVSENVAANKKSAVVPKSVQVVDRTQAVAEEESTLQRRAVIRR